MSGRRLLAVVGAWLALSIAVGGITAAVLGPAIVAPVIVAEVYALLIAALVVGLSRDALAVHRTSAAEVVWALAACGAAYAVVAGLEALLAPAWASATFAVLRGMGSDDGRLASAGPLLTVLIVGRAVVLAPLGEELLFRGALYGWLRRRLPAWATIGVTAAAFAPIHAFPAVLPLAFGIGVAFGWVRERSGSTVPTIVAHVVHNTLMIAASYLLTGGAARLPEWGLP